MFQYKLSVLKGQKVALCSFLSYSKYLSNVWQRYDFSLNYLIFANNVNDTEMKIRIYRILTIVFFASMMTLGGCAKLSEIRPTSVAVSSISPRGMRALSLKIDVGVHNPATELTLSEISGEFLVSGKVIGNVTLDPLTLTARTDSVYRISADVMLADDVNVMEVLGLFNKKRTLEDAALNVYAKAKLKSGASKKIKYEQIPLKNLLEYLK